MFLDLTGRGRSVVGKGVRGNVEEVKNQNESEKSEEIGEDGFIFYIDIRKTGKTEEEKSWQRKSGRRKTQSH